MGTKSKTFDILAQFKDAGLVGADGVSQVGGSAKIVDVGAGEVHADMIIDVSAIEIATGDEHYEIVIQGSNSSSFASGVACLAALRLGKGSPIATVLGTGAAVDVDDTTGRYVIPFRNERNGTVYRYLRIYNAVTGTIATGINYIAFMAKR